MQLPSADDYDPRIPCGRKFLVHTVVNYFRTFLTPLRFLESLIGDRSQLMLVPSLLTPSPFYVPHQ